MCVEGFSVIAGSTIDDVCRGAGCCLITGSSVSFLIERSEFLSEGSDFAKFSVDSLIELSESSDFARFPVDSLIEISESSDFARFPVASLIGRSESSIERSDFSMEGASGSLIAGAVVDANLLHAADADFPGGRGSRSSPSMMIAPRRWASRQDTMISSLRLSVTRALTTMDFDL